MASAKSIIVFGTGAVGSSLVDLLATRAGEFGILFPVRVVAASPDATRALASKYGSAAHGNGGGGGGGAAGNGGGGAAAEPAPMTTATTATPTPPTTATTTTNEVTLVDCDACDASAVRRAMDAAREGGRSVLAVVNAMGSFHVAPLSEMTGDEVAALVSREVLPAANVLKAAMHCLGETQQREAQAPTPAAGSQGQQQQAAAAGPGGEGGAGGFGASIVAVTASVTHHGMKHHEAFAAAKGAVEAMHLSAAATLAQRGVKVNVVAPGLIQSPASAEQSLQEPAATKSAGLYPPHRLARPEEVAAALAVAASPGLLPFTTGAVIACDGGLSRVATYAAPTQHV